MEVSGDQKVARWTGTGVAKSKVRAHVETLQDTTVVCLSTQSPAIYLCVLGKNHKHFCASASASLKHNSIQRAPLPQNSYWEAKNTLRMPVNLHKSPGRLGGLNPLLSPTLSLLPAHHTSLLTSLFSITLTSSNDVL